MDEEELIEGMVEPDEDESGEVPGPLLEDVDEELVCSTVKLDEEPKLLLWDADEELGDVLEPVDKPIPLLREDDEIEKVPRLLELEIELLL